VPWTTTTRTKCSGGVPIPTTTTAATEHGAKCRFCGKAFGNAPRRARASQSCAAYQGAAEKAAAFRQPAIGGSLGNGSVGKTGKRLLRRRLRRQRSSLAPAATAARRRAGAAQLREVEDAHAERDREAEARRMSASVFANRNWTRRGPRNAPRKRQGGTRGSARQAERRELRSGSSRRAPQRHSGREAAGCRLVVFRTCPSDFKPRVCLAIEANYSPSHRRDSAPRTRPPCGRNPRQMHREEKAKTEQAGASHDSGSVLIEHGLAYAQRETA